MDAERRQERRLGAARGQGCRQGPAGNAEDRQTPQKTGQGTGVVEPPLPPNAGRLGSAVTLTPEFRVKKSGGNPRAYPQPEKIIAPALGKGPPQSQWSSRRHPCSQTKSPRFADVEAAPTMNGSTRPVHWRGPRCRVALRPPLPPVVERRTPHAHESATGGGEGTPGALARESSGVAVPIRALPHVGGRRRGQDAGGLTPAPQGDGHLPGQPLLGTQ